MIAVLIVFSLSISIFATYLLDLDFLSGALSILLADFIFNIFYKKGD